MNSSCTQINTIRFLCTTVLTPFLFQTKISQFCIRLIRTYLHILLLHGSLWDCPTIYLIPYKDTVVPQLANMMYLLNFLPWNLLTDHSKKNRCLLWDVLLVYFCFSFSGKKRFLLSMLAWSSYKAGVTECVECSCRLPTEIW